MPILSRHETGIVDFSKVCAWVCLATANPGEAGIDKNLMHRSRTAAAAEDVADIGENQTSLETIPLALEELALMGC